MVLNLLFTYLATLWTGIEFPTKPLRKRKQLIRISLLFRKLFYPWPNPLLPHILTSWLCHTCSMYQRHLQTCFDPRKRSKKIKFPCCKVTTVFVRSTTTARFSRLGRTASQYTTNLMRNSSQGASHNLTMAFVTDSQTEPRITYSRNEGKGRI